MYKAIDFILRKMLVSARDLFEEEDEFVEFRRDADSGARSGTNSTSVSGQIEYRRRDRILTSPRLFLKISPDVLSFETLHLQMHVNEVYFYSRIRPYFHGLRNVDRCLPKFYASHLDVSERACHEILVLEDLQSGGFGACRRQNTSLDLAHLSLMMRKLGEFHAYSYKACVVDPDNFSRLAHSFKNVFRTFAAQLCPRTVQRWKMACEPLRRDARYDDVLAKFDSVLENFADFVEESLAVPNGRVSVLCHHSFSRDNVLFRYEGDEPVDAVIVDWQTCLPSGVGVDVLGPLYMNADQKTRDEHWDSLMDEYHRALSQTFPEIVVPSKDELMEALRMKVGALMQVAAFRMPHKNFAVYRKIQFIRTDSSEEEFVDPLTSILKDMIDRKLFG